MPQPTPQQIERVIQHIRRQIESWTLVRGGLKKFRAAKILSAAGIDEVLEGLIGLADVKVSEASASLELHEGMLAQVRSSIVVPDLGRHQ